MIRGASRAVGKSVTTALRDLTTVSKGGEGTTLLLEEREKPGYLCFRNSYWQASLFSLRGRAVPWLPLIIYMAYTALVCLADLWITNNEQIAELKELSSVTTTVGVALFLLLSFRNNAAYTRWQTGTDRFKNFAHLAKNTARVIAGNLSSYVAVGGREAAYDLVQGRLKWLMAALEMGRQHLRGEVVVAHLLDLLDQGDIERVQADADPVLYCMYKVLDMDRKYVVNKCNEWMRSCDQIYMEFCACINVYTTPIPLAYISHLRTFLVLWLGCVPWVYVSYYGWYTLALCAVIGYGIIGIEEAAVEVEQPFGRDFNDIPLDSIVADAYRAIATYVRIVREAEEEDARAHSPAGAVDTDGVDAAAARGPGGEGAAPEGAPPAKGADATGAPAQDGGGKGGGGKCERAGPGGRQEKGGGRGKAGAAGGADSGLGTTGDDNC